MDWLYLFIAGICEIIWIVFLKYSNGFTRYIPGAITILALILSTWLLALSLRSISIGTAYAIWTSIGIMGSSIAGIVLFTEPFHISKIIFILLILIGIIGLKLF